MFSPAGLLPTQACLLLNVLPSMVAFRLAEQAKKFANTANKDLRSKGMKFVWGHLL
jgi:hypothetical protein